MDGERATTLHWQPRQPTKYQVAHCQPVALRLRPRIRWCASLQQQRECLILKGPPITERVRGCCNRVSSSLGCSKLGS
jgi:hypothetical protein